MSKTTKADPLIEKLFQNKSNNAYPKSWFQVAETLGFLTLKQNQWKEFLEVQLSREYLPYRMSEVVT